MADLFLEEVRRIRTMRFKLRAMGPEARARLIAELGDDAADDWALGARDEQLPPEDLDWAFLFLGGRGCGKTRALSGAIHTAVRAGVSGFT